MSEFVRSAAQARAEQVLRVHDTQTTVPAAFFEELLTALDSPEQSNGALARAAQRARRLVLR